MANGSAIEWTDATWNPTTGCDKVSSGCRHCYAERMAARLQAMGCARYAQGFELAMHWDKIDDPLSWRKPRKVFVNSMSDLFHADVSDAFVRRVFEVMQATPQHQYQVLTKRPERMRALLDELMLNGEWCAPPHIWLGTSIEDARVLPRLEHLRATPAGVRFLSCEPLIGPLGEVAFDNIHWVIVGGESGVHLHRARLAERRALVSYTDQGWQPREDRMDWVREIRDQCLAQEVPFFFKQWGGRTPKATGRTLDGRTWDMYPDMMLALQRHDARMSA